MDLLLYLIARTVVTFIQTLPLAWVARLGRAGGAVAYWVDGRHRRVALQNLELIFGSRKTAAERTAIARENFRRMGEVFACMIKIASLSDAEIQGILELVGTLPPNRTAPARSAAESGHGWRPFRQL
jgi:lauroyl/myristoyl acyltransferase